jgi:tetratricopeptide (TPR) repeat protein
MKYTSILLALLTAHSAFAQSYPLSENTWSNPAFVDRFMGSFGVDTEKSPSVTKEEGDIFRSVANVGTSPSAAISILRGAINSESSGAMDFALANFLLQQGNMSSAINSYNTAIRKFPNFGRAYKNLGLAYIQTGDYKNALPNLTKSLEILGGDGGLFGLIGFCHLNNENYGPALDAYKLALVFEPDSRDWRLGQLKALQSLQKYDEVESIIYSYIEENPTEPEFWLQQANAFIAQSDYDKAAANFEIVKMLGAADRKMYVLLGDIYVNLDAPSLALEPYEKALATGEVKADDALQLAKILSRRLPTDELKEFLEMITSTYGDTLNQEDSLTLLTLKAGNALAMNDKVTAMDILSQVVAKDPLNGSALLTLGSYYLQEGDLVKSLDYYDRATKVESVKIEALLGTARVLVKQSKYQAAINRLKEAQMIKDQAFIAQYINTLQKFVN